MTETIHTDIAILGGGPGGYSCALRASQLGLRVVIVERDEIGGTCLHRGCIPTKALLHAGEIADRSREAAAYGIVARYDGVDVPALHAYKARIVNGLHRGLRGLLRQRGVQIIAADGQLVDTTTIAAGDHTVIAERAVVLATGSRPTVPAGFEPDGERILTSDDALQLERIPASAVVLGGGVIGVEFASLWRSLGAEVTVIEQLDRLLPTELPASSDQLTAAFTRRGIGCRPGTRVAAVDAAPDCVRIDLDNGDKLEADVALVAFGRRPNSDQLPLADLGIRTTGAHVAVDGWCRTSAARVYAVGDLRPGPQLAHAAFADGIVVAEDIAGLTPAALDYDTLPRITYSDPEVVSVGLTTDGARAAGVDVVEHSYDLAGNGRAQILGATGTLTVVAGPDGRVHGLHLVGRGVSELAGEAELITAWEADTLDVARIIHPHPTLTEALGELHLAAAGMPLHTH